MGWFSSEETKVTKVEPLPFNTREVLEELKYLKYISNPNSDHNGNTKVFCNMIMDLHKRIQLLEESKTNKVSELDVYLKPSNDNNILDKYLFDFGLTRDKPYIVAIFGQIQYKGFTDRCDIINLCEYFPHSCHKVLRTYGKGGNGDDFKIYNFYDLLISDLEVLLDDSAE